MRTLHAVAAAVFAAVTLVSCGGGGGDSGGSSEAPVDTPKPPTAVVPSGSGPSITTAPPPTGGSTQPTQNISAMGPGVPVEPPAGSPGGGTPPTPPPPSIPSLSSMIPVGTIGMSTPAIPGALSGHTSGEAEPSWFPSSTSRPPTLPPISGEFPGFAGTGTNLGGNMPLQPVPEPETVVIFSMGALALAWVLWKRMRTPVRMPGSALR